MKVGRQVRRVAQAVIYQDVGYLGQWRYEKYEFTNITNELSAFILIVID